MNRTLICLFMLAACSPRPGAVAADATPATRGVEVGDLNRSVDPCTDLDEFANGSWRRANPIPNGKPRWNRRLAARDTNRRQLQQLLEELSAKTDWPAGSIEQLLGDHYAACVDQRRVDSEGVKPLAPLLAEIAAARTPADLQRMIRRLNDLGIAAPFSAAGAMNVHEPLRFILNLGAGGLGLPDSSKPEALETYRLRVAQLLTVAGVVSAQGEAANVVALEKKLAEASLDAATAADPLKTDHLMTFEQLVQLAPHFEWATALAEAGLARDDVNVAEPKFLQRFDAELTATPISTWRAYLAYRLLDSASPWLSSDLTEANPKPRALRCVDLTESLFGDALAQKYVERYFPKAAKAKMTEIGQSLLAALKTEVAQQVKWLTPETKRRALEKLGSYDLQLGYPPAWVNYTGVSVHRDTLWANVAAGRQFNVAHDRQRIGKPTSRDVWQLSATSADAYIDLQLNQIVLPAGYLQPPAFSLEAADAVNYGAIGVAMAHDLTHAIDLLGAENDAQGRPANWWSDADREQFQSLGGCVARQFEGYFIEPGTHHQGKQVLGEAVGDLAGMRLAWFGLQRSLEAGPARAVDALTPAQQFFISWAQFRGADERLEAQREAIKTDSHPVAKSRVIGTVSNFAEFQQAFACPADAPLVRSPERRCAVW